MFFGGANPIHPRFAAHTPEIQNVTHTEQIKAAHQPEQNFFGGANPIYPRFAAHTPEIQNVIHTQK